MYGRHWSWGWDWSHRWGRHKGYRGTAQLPNEYRRGKEAQEAGLGKILLGDFEALLLRGVKCHALMSLSLSTFTGRSLGRLPGLGSRE